MKFKFLLCLFVLTSCGHAPMVQSIVELTKYQRNIPDICKQEVDAGHYNRNMQGLMQCRKDVMVAKAKRIDFAAVQDMEAYMDIDVDLGAKYDAQQIDRDQFMQMVGVNECEMMEKFAQNYKKYNISSRTHNMEERVGDKCRSQLGTIVLH